MTQLIGGKWRTKRSEEVDGRNSNLYYTGFPDSEKRNSNVTGYPLHFEEIRNQLKIKPFQDISTEEKPSDLKYDGKFIKSGSDLVVNFALFASITIKDTVTSECCGFFPSNNQCPFHQMETEGTCEGCEMMIGAVILHHVPAILQETILPVR